MNKLSVVIGRFQTPLLTEGHLNLIKEAKRKGDALLILIGSSGAIGTDKNPLSYEIRRRMIDDALLGNDYVIKELKDHPLSDKDWSDEIDSIIENLGFEDATLYGGRNDNIKDYYCGKHKVEILGILGRGSATEVRTETGKRIIYSREFRDGIVYHTQNRYPIVYSTVDIALMNKGRVLMGKKGDKLTFIGGFIDTSDNSYAEAALRELKEETGIEGIGLEFLFSCKVNDARYAGTKDSIMTNFFRGYLETEELFNESKISDKEFKEFQWVKLEEESLNLVSGVHQNLFNNLLSIHLHN